MLGSPVLGVFEELPGVERGVRVDIGMLMGTLYEDLGWCHHVCIGKL